MPYDRAARSALTGPERLEERELPAAPVTNFPVLPKLDPAVSANVRQIAAVGRANGLRSDAFMKIGDSNTDTDEFLRPAGNFGFNPALAGITDPNLIGTIATFLAPAGGDGRNSFARNSLADFPGWRVADVLARAEAELADTRAGLALILIGTNDVGTGTPPDTFRAMLGQLVDRLTARGVVPILNTLPRNLHNPGYEPHTARFNQIIADVAAERRVPLLNLSRALDGIPLHGLKADAVHLSVSPRGGGAFQPADLIFGQNLRGLLTIRALASVGQAAFRTPPAAVAAATGLTPWTPLGAGEPAVAFGADFGQPPVVTLSDPTGNRILSRFLAFAPNFTGGVRLAVADLTGDGVPDIVAGAGPGGGPVVKAFDGLTGAELLSLFAFEPTFRGGVHVAAGDLDGDGSAEVIVGAGRGGGPRVRAYRAADLAPIADFLAFEPNFRGGVTVAVGDFGPAFGQSILVGPGAGGGAVLKVFDATGELLSSRELFEPAYRGGLSVAAGDLDGDGNAEILAGSATTATRVVVTDAVGNRRASFFADGFAPAGVRLAVVPARMGLPGRIVTGTIYPTGSVGLFDEFGNSVRKLVGSDQSVVLAGVFVAAG